MKEGAKFRLCVKRIDLGIFQFPVYFVTGKHKDADAYARWKFDEPNLVGDTHPCGSKGMTYFKPGYVVIIWMPRKPKTIDEMSTAAHEALHAVQKLFDWASMPMNSSTDEVAAHALAHIVREMATR